MKFNLIKIKQNDKGKEYKTPIPKITLIKKKYKSKKGPKIKTYEDYLLEYNNKKNGK